MTAAEIVSELVARHHELRVEGRKLIVAPRSPDELRPYIVASKGDIVAFVAERGGVWPAPPASAHRYIVWRGTLDLVHSVCLSCGVPPVFHGEDALEDPLVVDHPDDAVLLQASCVAATAAAIALAAREPGEAP